MKPNEYRVVVKHIGGGMFSESKSLLVIQKRVSRFSRYGYTELCWVDCSTEDVTNVTLSLFCEKESK